jgi:hypothetical protein
MCCLLNANHTRNRHFQTLVLKARKGLRCGFDSHRALDIEVSLRCAILKTGSIKWPTHIFTKWPFCMGHLQNTLRRYADKTEVDPMKLTLSAGLRALLIVGASFIGGYARISSP